MERYGFAKWLEKVGRIATRDERPAEEPGDASRTNLLIERSS